MRIHGTDRGRAIFRNAAAAHNSTGKPQMENVFNALRVYRPLYCRGATRACISYVHAVTVFDIDLLTPFWTESLNVSQFRRPGLASPQDSSNHPSDSEKETSSQTRYTRRLPLQLLSDTDDSAHSNCFGIVIYWRLCNILEYRNYRQ